MDGKHEKHFQNVEKENKELKLSYFTEFRTSIFPHIQTSEIKLSLTISSDILESLWTRKLSPGGCQVLSMREPGLSCSCYKHLIELCTLLCLHGSLIAI